MPLQKKNLANLRAVRSTKSTCSSLTKMAKGRESKMAISQVAMITPSPAVQLSLGRSGNSITVQRSHAMAAIVNVETYTEVIRVMFAKPHMNSPNGQLSRTLRTMLKGMFRTVIMMSEMAKLAMNIFVTVCNLLQTSMT